MLSTRMSARRETRDGKRRSSGGQNPTSLWCVSAWRPPSWPHATDLLVRFRRRASFAGRSGRYRTLDQDGPGPIPAAAPVEGDPDAEWPAVGSETAQCSGHSPGRLGPVVCPPRRFGHRGVEEPEQLLGSPEPCSLRCQLQESDLRAGWLRVPRCSPHAGWQRTPS